MKPIIFSGPMVRALLEDRKTKTRRVIKGSNLNLLQRWDGPEDDGAHYFGWASHCDGIFAYGRLKLKPLYQPGDILWVRERWRIGAWNENTQSIAVDYKDAVRREWLFVPDVARFKRYVKQSIQQAKDAGIVQDKNGEYHWESGNAPTKWRPSIYMPREAARLFLRVTDVQAERLQDISEEDALAEGVRPDPPIKMVDGKYGSEWSARDNFIELWDSLNAKRGFGWDANPWVWVYTFERFEQSELHEETP